VKREGEAGRLVPWIVNLGYLAATCAEALLAPIFPVAADDLGIDLAAAGFAFALLAVSIAVGNIAGGSVLTHLGPKVGILLGLALASGGGLLAASSSDQEAFLAAQAVIGLGSGIYFASGLWSAAGLAGARRRGLAMGFFGIAFSGGLATAALLAAVGGVDGWQIAYVVSACLTGVIAIATLLVPLPARPEPRHESTAGWHRALGIPLAVGGVASASQYGTISFIPTFAVTVWGVSPSAAAVLLAVARVISIPSKLFAGVRSDRRGALATAGEIGLLLAITGAGWAIGPTAVLGAAPAAVFAAAVSGLGPVSNVLALEAFGQRGTMIGLFRSLQIALGAAVSALIGVSATAFGLQPTLVVAATMPIVLTVLARRVRRRSQPPVA
jgi:predicted MFS family arabinose efflux permease